MLVGTIAVAMVPASLMLQHAIVGMFSRAAKSYDTAEFPCFRQVIDPVSGPIFEEVPCP